MNGIYLNCVMASEKPETLISLIDFLKTWQMDSLFSGICPDTLASNVDLYKKISRHALDAGINFYPAVEASALALGAGAGLESLADSLISLFPAKYMHMGFSESEFRKACAAVGAEPETAFPNAVKRLASVFAARAVTPVIWAELPLSLSMTVHGVALADSRSGTIDSPSVCSELRKRQNRELFTVPSIACQSYALFPPADAFINVSRMASFASRYKCEGSFARVENSGTFIKGVMFYAIAYSSEAFKNSGKVNVLKFRRKFAEKVFGTSLNHDLNGFLTHWPQGALRSEVFEAFRTGNFNLSAVDMKLAEKSLLSAHTAVNYSSKYSPELGRPFYEAMCFSAELSFVMNGLLLEKNGKLPDSCRDAYAGIFAGIKGKTASIPLPGLLQNIVAGL